MDQDPAFNDVISAFASGRFKTARERLIAQKHELQRTNGVLFSALLTDLDLQSGDLSTAQRSAEILLRQTQSTPMRATAYRILAETSAHRLQFEANLSHYEAAPSLSRARVSRPLCPTFELHFLVCFPRLL